MDQFVFTILFLIISSALASLERGINAKEGEFKYQAMLYSLIEPEHVDCGGAIISEWYVLSSVHCTYQYRRQLHNLVAYFGTINVHKKQQKREITEIKIPMEFDWSKEHHDIALIRVSKKIEYSANIQPINLPTDANVHAETLVSSGFGIRFYPGHISQLYARADNLHYHKTSIVPMEQCKAIYDKSYVFDHYKSVLGNDFICTENVEGFTFLDGDEGNPLVANNILYGIASCGSYSRKYPNIYTKVFAHMQWIEDNLNLQ